MQDKSAPIDVPAIQRDGKTLLDAAEVAKSLGWELKIVVEGKLATLCQGGDDDFCIPLQLNAIKNTNHNGRLFIEAADLLRPMNGELVVAGKVRATIVASSSSQGTSDEELAYKRIVGRRSRVSSRSNSAGHSLG